jgi:hypothetical protein
VLLEPAFGTETVSLGAAVPFFVDEDGGPALECLAATASNSDEPTSVGC